MIAARPSPMRPPVFPTCGPRPAGTGIAIHDIKPGQKANCDAVDYGCWRVQEQLERDHLELKNQVAYLPSFFSGAMKCKSQEAAIQLIRGQLEKVRSANTIVMDDGVGSDPTPFGLATRLGSFHCPPLPLCRSPSTAPCP